MALHRRMPLLSTQFSRRRMNDFGKRVSTDAAGACPAIAVSTIPLPSALRVPHLSRRVLCYRHSFGSLLCGVQVRLFDDYCGASHTMRVESASAICAAKRAAVGGRHHEAGEITGWRHVTWRVRPHRRRCARHVTRPRASAPTAWRATHDDTPSRTAMRATATQESPRAALYRMAAPSVASRWRATLQWEDPAGAVPVAMGRQNQHCHRLYIR